MLNDIEIWKPIPGFEGYYEVSDHGRIKSLPRRLRGRGTNKRITRIKILRPRVNGSGYLTFMPCINYATKSITIHSVVMLAFIGPRPDGMQIDHVDYNKKNNCLSNLRYCTPRQNMESVFKNKLRSKVHSKYMGVCWHKMHKRWISSICINGKLNFLGYFNDEYQAHLAYQNALNKIKI